MRHTRSFLLTCTLLVATPAFACGEGVFNMGDGLRYQGYLAPRPATVLVYEVDGMPSDERVRVYRGLAQAGHRLSLARTPQELATALERHRFDIVIASADALDSVPSTASRGSSQPQLLPIVARANRTAVRQADYVIDGASLGQYLKLINRMMKG